MQRVRASDHRVALVVFALGRPALQTAVKAAVFQHVIAVGRLALFDLRTVKPCAARRAQRRKGHRRTRSRRRERHADAAPCADRLNRQSVHSAAAHRARLAFHARRVRPRKAGERIRPA